MGFPAGLAHGAEAPLRGVSQAPSLCPGLAGHSQAPSTCGLNTRRDTCVGDLGQLAAAPWGWACCLPRLRPELTPPAPCTSWGFGGTKAGLQEEVC